MNLLLNSVIVFSVALVSSAAHAQSLPVTITQGLNSTTYSLDLSNIPPNETGTIQNGPFGKILTFPYSIYSFETIDASSGFAMRIAEDGESPSAARLTADLETKSVYTINFTVISTPELDPYSPFVYSNILLTAPSGFRLVCKVSNGAFSAGSIGDWSLPGPGDYSVSCPSPIGSFSFEGGIIYPVAFGAYGAGDEITQISFISSPGPMSSVISATSAHFEQVVEDPQITANASGVFDAVAGKSASFKIGLTGSNLSQLPPSGTVTVKVMDGSGAPLSQTLQPIPLSQFSAAGTYTIAPNMMTGFKPTTAIKSPLSIQVTSAISGFTSTPYMSMSLNVHQVTSPNIGFAQIDEPEICIQLPCFVSANPTAANVSDLLKSNNFLSSVYPVADQSIIYSPAESVIFGIDPSGLAVIPHKPTDPDPRIAESWFLDINQLETTRRTLGLDRMVGIVPTSYFDSHGFDEFTGGFTPWSPTITKTTPHVYMKTSMVKEDETIATVAHELGHTFGVDFEDYDDTLRTYGGLHPEVTGYDAINGTTYSFPMSAAGSLAAWSFMGPSGLPDNITGYWVDNTTYTTIFNSLVSPPPGDPATILVTGVLTKYGTFIFGPSTNLPNGTLTPTTPGGDFTMSALDANGNLVTAVAMQSNFTGLLTYKALSTSAPSLVDVGAMSVVLELPANASIDRLQVTQNGKILQTTSLGGQLLIGIINRIPDSAFKSQDRCDRDHDHDDNSKRSARIILKDRKLLNEAVSRIQAILNKGKLKGDDARRVQELFDQLTSDIKRLTYESYAIADQSQLTQSQVLAQIQSIVKNLDLDKICDSDAKDRLSR